MKTFNLDFGKIRFRLISGLVRDLKPQELYICRVDNWFDSKWLNFSGKTLGAVGIWKNETTIPPFNPNRITGEGIFDRQNDATENSCIYKLRKDAESIHPNQPSEANLKRKIKDLSDDALFIWVSENTELNKFGSIMVYVVNKGNVSTFYLSLRNTSEQSDSEHWELQKVSGTNAKQINYYVERGEAYQLRLDVD